MTGIKIADFFAKFSLNIDESAIKKMDSTIKGVDQKLSSLSQKTQNFENNTKNLSKSFDAISLSLSNVGTAIAGAFTIHAGYEFGKSIYEAGVHFETVRNQVFNVTKDIGTANKYMRELLEFSSKSGLNFENMSESFGSFMMQMNLSHIAPEKSMSVFQKLQTGMTGLGVTGQQAFLVNRDILEYLHGAISYKQLSKMEFGRMGLTTSLAAVYDGSSEKAGQELDKMKPEQKADAIANAIFKSAEMGLKEYEKSAMASRERLRNSWILFEQNIAEGGFMDFSSSVFKKLKNGIDEINESAPSLGHAFKNLADALNNVNTNTDKASSSQLSFAKTLGYLIEDFTAGFTNKKTVSQQTDKIRDVERQITNENWINKLKNIPDRLNIKVSKMMDDRLENTREIGKYFNIEFLKNLHFKKYEKLLQSSIDERENESNKITDKLKLDFIEGLVGHKIKVKDREDLIKRYDVIKNSFDQDDGSGVQYPVIPQLKYAVKYSDTQDKTNDLLSKQVTINQNNNVQISAAGADPVQIKQVFDEHINAIHRNALSDHARGE